MFASRRRVIGYTLALFLLLDGGRSWYARLGAQHPTRIWSADKAHAEPIAWPPGSDLKPGAPMGQRVYARHCAVCHGPTGHGNGPAAPSLHPRPRDFTSGTFKLKSTPSNEPPTLADVRAAIDHGMPGTSMPFWSDQGTEESFNAVARYILQLGPHSEFAARGLEVPSEVLDAASAERGRTLYSDLGCPACHGAEGRGDGAAARDLKDATLQPDPPRDLTAPWTFRGGSSALALYRRIMLGMAGTPMPGYAEVATPQQVADVVAFISSVARVPPWQAGGVLAGPGLATDLTRRGEYLVHAGMCGLCHTPVDPNGIYLADTHYLAGGMKVEAGAHGVFFARNLTSDAATGLGNWSVDQIATAIRSGHTPHGRLNYWGMPWMVLGAMTSDDTLAVATYLKTLPAVSNHVPGPLHYGFVETVVRKLRYAWPALLPERLAYYAGNFGYEQPVTFERDAPQRVLIWLQWIVVVLGTLACAVAGPPRYEPRRGVTFLVLVLLGVTGGAAIVIYRYPAVDMLPAATVIQAFASAIPEVATEGLPAHEAALLQRGRYLYGVASCPYCHNGNGGGGGKVNWEVLGTTFAHNLTSHETGLATWSDEAVLRALISGVSRDGRALHWQAMIWDHLSNYDIEDQRALLAYVRALPPIDRALPAPVAPGGHDCPGDTFWIGTTNFDPGCG